MKIHQIEAREREYKEAQAVVDANRPKRDPLAGLTSLERELLAALQYARRLVNASECDIAYIDAAIAKARL